MANFDVSRHIAESDLVITDWSGVISDDRMPVYEANARMLEGYGRPRTTFHRWLELAHGSAYDFLTSQGITGTVQELTAQYTDIYGKVVAEGIGPEMYPDAIRFMRAVQEKGKKIVVVSSHPESHLRKEAEQYGLTDYIDHISGSRADKVPAIKAILGETDMRAWYLGDTIYDVQAARKAKLPIVSITTGYHTRAMLEAEKPDQIVDSLSEILPHL